MEKKIEEDDHAVPRPKSPMKVLYLDFDGVLHDDSVIFHRRRGIVMSSPGHQLFEWQWILERLLRPHPSVSIVLSTSWVRIRSFNFARGRLSAELRERVIGATFHKQHMHLEDFLLLPRGAQVANDVFRRGPTAWFALDDDHIGWPSWCRDNLIKTDGKVGISDPKIQEAIRLMLERF